MTTKTRKFRLKDVDGTIPGVCVMTVVRLDPDVDEGKVFVSCDRFVEAPDRPNPHEFAERFWSSLEDDWPGCAVAYSLNQRARFLMMNGRMRSMLGENATQDPHTYWTENA